MRTITVWLSAFDETLATRTAVDFRISANFLSWFLPLIASHGLFAAPMERLSFCVDPSFYNLVSIAMRICANAHWVFVCLACQLNQRCSLGNSADGGARLLWSKVNKKYSYLYWRSKWELLQCGCQRLMRRWQPRQKPPVSCHGFSLSLLVTVFLPLPWSGFLFCV